MSRFHCHQGSLYLAAIYFSCSCRLAIIVFVRIISLVSIIKSNPNWFKQRRELSLCNQRSVIYNKTEWNLNQELRQQQLGLISPPPQYPAFCCSGFIFRFLMMASSSPRFRSFLMLLVPGGKRSFFFFFLSLSYQSPYFNGSDWVTWPCQTTSVALGRSVWVICPLIDSRRSYLLSK